ncbi:MAG TPA: tetratricopeptide repeat protein, partial [Bryobacteraceae bacterium]|nr:tetratricopeptide repeat protein [Bryobacteraceae bacterium]
MAGLGGAQSLSESPQAETASGELLVARSKQRAGEYVAARDILLEALSTTLRSASLLNQLGSVQQDLGEYLEAERFYLQALNACTQTGSDLERLVILNNLGTLYLDTSNYSKSEQIRELLEKLRPGTLNNHPAEAGALLNAIASLEHARGRNDEAERYYSRSLLLFRQAHAGTSVD